MSRPRFRARRDVAMAEFNELRRRHGMPEVDELNPDPDAYPYVWNRWCGYQRWLRHDLARRPDEEIRVEFADYEIENPEYMADLGALFQQQNARWHRDG